MEHQEIMREIAFLKIKKMMLKRKIEDVDKELQHLEDEIELFRTRDHLIIYEYYKKLKGVLS